MKKLMSLEDTATITITGRDAVRLATVLGWTNGHRHGNTYDNIVQLLPEDFDPPEIGAIDYISVQKEAEALAFPQLLKKDLMLKELQSKMDALQCEIDKIKGEKF